jgi:beta-mannosidase
VSHSLLDHRRRPKAAYEAVKAACAPVIVVARPSSTTRGRACSVDLHLVSDRREPMEGLELTARFGIRTRRWVGEVGPDATSYVGSVDLDLGSRLPETPTALGLELLGPDGHPVATNCYDIGIDIAIA